MSTDFHSVAHQSEGLLAVRDSKPIDDRVTVSVAATKSLTVVDAATYARAGEHLTGFAGLAKQIEAYFKDDVDRAFKLHRSLTAKRKQALDVVERESTRLRGERQRWKAQQDALQRQAEQQATIAAKRHEEERLTAEAALLVDQGQPELAEAVLEQAITAPAPVVVLPSCVPQDLPQRTLYQWRVINPALVPREFLCLDEKKLTAYATAMKGAARVAGIDFYNKDIDIVRST